MLLVLVVHFSSFVAFTCGIYCGFPPNMNSWIISAIWYILPPYTIYLETPSFPKALCDAQILILVIE